MISEQAMVRRLALSLKGRRGPFPDLVPLINHHSSSPFVGDHRTDEQKELDHRTALEKRKAKEERRYTRLSGK